MPAARRVPKEPPICVHCRLITAIESRLLRPSHRMTESCLHRVSILDGYVS